VTKLQSAQLDWDRMRTFQSKYIVKAYAFCPPTKGKSYPRIVQEWLPFGDLRHLKVLAGDLALDWDFHLRISEQLAAAMATIHKAGYSMEDLVPGQFLITGTPNYEVKVVDIDSLRRVPKSGYFRCFCWGDPPKQQTAHSNPPASHLWQHRRLLHTTSSLQANSRRASPEAEGSAATHHKVHRCGYERTDRRNKHCLAWRSPEQIRCEERCTLKSDVFSLAMVMWALMPHTGLPYGEWPYGDPKDGITRQQVLRGAGHQQPSLPLDCPSQYAAVLRRCWRNDPTRRPSMSQLRTAIHEIREERHDLKNSP